MKQGPTYLLQMHEPIASSGEWKRIQADLAAAIASIAWPEGSDRFTINPVKMGNGVVPIREAFQQGLNDLGWAVEQQSVPNVGDVDAALDTPIGTFAVEWETGNISSSHRSLNRLSLGILSGSLVGGVLVLPSRKLYRYLTDRVGNVPELMPYFPIYERLNVPPCVLAVIEVEHDDEDPTVPRIRKGTDGRALFQGKRLEDER